jgi:flagellar biosynthesis protein FlhF
MFQVPLEVVATAREMRRARQQFAGFDLVLVDTAGIRPGDLSAIRVLGSLLLEAGIDEAMLVLNANGSQDSMLEAVEGFGSVGITSLMLTKFDEATRLGQLLPLLQQSHLPVSYVSDGQGIPQDLQPAEPRWLARRLLGCHPVSGLATGQLAQDHL